MQTVVMTISADGQDFIPPFSLSENGISSPLFFEAGSIFFSSSQTLSPSTKQTIYQAAYNTCFVWHEYMCTEDEQFGMCESSVMQK